VTGATVKRFGLPCPSCKERGVLRIGPGAYRCNACMYDFYLAQLMPRLMDGPIASSQGRLPIPEQATEGHLASPRLSLVKLQEIVR